MISVLFACFTAGLGATDYCPPHREVVVQEFRGSNSVTECDKAKREAEFQTKFKAPNAGVWYYCESAPTGEP